MTLILDMVDDVVDAPEQVTDELIRIRQLCCPFNLCLGGVGLAISDILRNRTVKQ